MIVHFATCDFYRALPWLQAAYPGQIMSRETLPKLYAAMHLDIVRIKDPAMYGVCALMTTEKYADHYDDNGAYAHELVDEMNNAPSAASVAVGREDS